MIKTIVSLGQKSKGLNGRLSRSFGKQKDQLTEEELRKKRILEQAIRDKVEQRIDEDMASRANTKAWRKGVKNVD